MRNKIDLAFNFVVLPSGNTSSMHIRGEQLARPLTEYAQPLVSLAGRNELDCAACLWRAWSYGQR